MPANLTHQYRKAEQDFRRATTPEEELSCLQAMLRELPKHKGTDKLQADLKQKISRAKRELESQQGGSKAYRVKIPRQGAGRVVLLGGPNAGKSQLVARVTRAQPEVAAYPFTTLAPLVAMMPYQDVLIQLIDTPPIAREVLPHYLQGIIRGADLVLLMVDLGDESGIEDCQDVLTQLGQTKTRLARHSCLDPHDVGLSFTQSLLVPNKIDAVDAGLRLELLHEVVEIDLPQCVISAQVGTGVARLQDVIFQALDIVRVYTKQPGQKEPEFDCPFTIRRGGTLGQVAAMVHQDLAREMKFARVWGTNVHDGTIVSQDYILSDQDVIEVHT